MPLGCSATGLNAAIELHSRLALLIAISRGVGFFPGTACMANGTIAPSPRSASPTVATVAKDGILDAAAADGARIHTIAIAPTMPSICAAGAVRVCQASSRVAASAGAAAASVRRSSSRSRAVASTPAAPSRPRRSAAAPAAASRSASRGDRPAAPRAHGSATAAATSGDTPSSRDRQCGHIQRVERRRRSPRAGGQRQAPLPIRRREPARARTARLRRAARPTATPATRRRTPPIGWRRRRTAGSRAPCRRRASPHRPPAAASRRDRRSRTARSPPPASAR